MFLYFFDDSIFYNQNAEILIVKLKLEKFICLKYFGLMKYLLNNFNLMNNISIHIKNLYTESMRLYLLPLKSNINIIFLHINFQS